MLFVSSSPRRDRRMRHDSRERWKDRNDSPRQRTSYSPKGAHRRENSPRKEEIGRTEREERREERLARQNSGLSKAELQRERIRKQQELTQKPKRERQEDPQHSWQLEQDEVDHFFYLHEIKSASWENNPRNQPQLPIRRPHGCGSHWLTLR